jgi:hypothetical protein
MSDDPRKGGGIFAAHAELIGRVTLMWSDVHAQVGHLFENFCASKEARKRYWETQSDRTQRQLLLSVGSVALQDYPDLRERLEKTLASVHPAHAHISRPERYASDTAAFPTLKETGLKTFHGF